MILVGSAARGDETAFSDIDLRVIVNSADGKWLTRDGSDGWVDGIYVDVGIVAKEAYESAAQALTNPTTANDMNDAIILYDPEGFLTEVQKEIRALFMEPKWVGMRVKPHIDGLRVRTGMLHAAIELDDKPNICIQAGRIFFSFGLIPLVVHGVSPSSTRSLVQLGEISAERKQQICELEETATLTREETLDAIDILSELTALADTDQWGEVPEYVVKKVTWMAASGYPREALHTAWFNCGFRLKACLDSGNQQSIAEVSTLAEQWLTCFGWRDKENIAEKLVAIDILWKDAQESTVDYIAAIN